MILSSRTEDSPNGTQMNVLGGKVTNLKDIQKNVGTQIEIKDLFYNTPARKKFLRKDTTEYLNIKDIFLREALANPNVKFILNIEGKESIRTSGNGIENAILEIFGKNYLKNFSKFSLGYLGNANLFKANKDSIFVFINGRSVKSKIVEEAVIAAYHTKLMKGKYPSALIFLDIDPAEIGKNKLIDVPIVGDLKNVLAELNQKVPKLSHTKWLDEVAKLKKKYSLTFRKTEEDVLIPQEILFEINKLTKGEVIVATDVGQHQMWTAQFIKFNNPYTILTSGGAGTMGFGLPAAIGAQVANPDKKVLAIVGDGGFQMTFQELMLIKEYNLPVKIFIINNSYLGMVRQWQELFNDRRYSSVDLSYNPDFIKIGEAYGIKSIQLKTKKDLKKHLKKILESDEAVLVECIVEKEENVYPMIPAGKDVSCIVGKRGVLDAE